MANNNGEIWTDILHNRQTVSHVYARASDNEHDQGVQTVLLKLNEGDTVSVENKVQASTIYGQRYSMFSGALLNFMPPPDDK